MANVLGIIRNKASGVAGAVDLFIDNVKQTQYKKCELLEYMTEFKSKSTLPYSFAYGDAVVYNGEIHLFGSSVSGNETKHYKWNGNSWTSVSTLPYSLSNGGAVVYNNAINLLGGSVSRDKHYYFSRGTGKRYKAIFSS